MDGRRRERHGVITRLYLELTGYPQVGGVAILSYQLDLAARAVVSTPPAATAPSGTAT